MARKAFHYMEVTFPTEIMDIHPGMMPVGIMKSLLDEYISETDDKNGKVLKEFVFDDINTYEWKDNIGAYAFEFMNERNRKTYFQARENFAAWLSAKGIETTYKLSHDIPLLPADEPADEDSPAFDGLYYYRAAKKYIFIEIPASRGFV